MKYNQIGYSNIRLLDNRNSDIYKYSSDNTFPQEVFVHEFLHTLERNEIENGNNIAKLHDYKIYNYKEKNINGLEEWYKDYMQNTINNGRNKGLTDFAYNSKPIYESDFKKTLKLDFFEEPKNIIEEIISIIERIKRLFK